MSLISLPTTRLDAFPLLFIEINQLIYMKINDMLNNYSFVNQLKYLNIVLVR